VREGRSGLRSLASPHRRLSARVRALILANRAGDESRVEQAVLDLSRSRRALAPLAFVVGAFVMLFDGLKLLVSNWRLTLVEVWPAMWIWFAMLDLRLHALRGRSFSALRGPVLIPLILAIAGLTAAPFYLNAVFAFAIAKPGVPEIRPAFGEARSHLRVILLWGVAVGLGLGVATMVFPRWGHWWFVISLSILVGVMMFAYVALPSRLTGIKVTRSRRDKLSASAIGGAIGAIVCAPPYALGRVGVLMLGSRALFVPGVVLLTLGITLQAGATGAVKAIKMSAKLTTGRLPEEPPPGDPGPAASP
jgi:hypothetical protein